MFTTQLLGGVVIVAAFFLSSCSSKEFQNLDPKIFYTRDVVFFEGSTKYEGVATLPAKDRYEFRFVPKGESNTAVLRNCHRSCSAEKKNGRWTSSCKSFKIINGKKKGWNPFSGGSRDFTYVLWPVKELESDRTCPFRAEFYDSENGQHAWAYMEFQNERYDIKGEITCNGAINTFDGVHACQAQVETTQMIKLDEPVSFLPVKPDTCNAAKRVQNHYEIKVAKGECLYQFDAKDGRLGKLSVIGVQGIKLGENK